MLSWQLHAKAHNMTSPAVLFLQPLVLPGRGHSHWLALFQVLLGKAVCGWYTSCTCEQSDSTARKDQHCLLKARCSPHQADSACNRCRSHCRRLYYADPCVAQLPRKRQQLMMQQLICCSLTYMKCSSTDLPVKDGSKEGRFLDSLAHENLLLGSFIPILKVRCEQ